MTESEARTILAERWWDSRNGVKRPEGMHIAIGYMWEEDAHNFWFYAIVLEAEEAPPEDIEEWTTWGVGKENGLCGARVF